MREINKGTEPLILTNWRRANPGSSYSDVTPGVREGIRTACADEQFYLCAYCGQKISGTSADTVNEHVEAQRIAPTRTVDFSNIVASCNTKKQCDSAHGSQQLPLTPLMGKCETELSYGIDGCVAGLTDRAKTTIEVLNLGSSLNNNMMLWMSLTFTAII